MTITVSKDLVVLAIVVAVIVVGYFLSFQAQKILAKGYKTFEKRIGSFTTRREYAIQRYVYQHRSSLVAKLYNWVNVQIIADRKSVV